MNDLRQAAQQALEALESMSDCYVGDDDDAGECASCHERSYKPHAPDCKKQNAITALKAALEQPEQEPFGYIWPTGRHAEFRYTQQMRDGVAGMPLYTHPPRREWQGLTTQEAMALTDTAPKGVFYGCDAGTGLGIWIAAVAAAERALKEKNHG